MATEGIAIEGMRDFRRDLDALSAAVPVAAAKVARESVERMEEQAHSRYGDFYPRPDSSRPASGESISYVQAETGATPALVLDGAAAPHLIGQEVGSNRYAQFAPWTGPAPDGEGAAGRFFYPAIRGESEGILDRLIAEIAPAVDRAFPTGRFDG